ELSLRTRGVDTIILTGGSTEIGVAATAYGAHALDFDIVFVSLGVLGCPWAFLRVSPARFSHGKAGRATRNRAWNQPVGGAAGHAT
ncbi:MAG: isochorismatase family protein, partial [Pseudomonadota bacterium]